MRTIRQGARAALAAVLAASLLASCTKPDGGRLAMAVADHVIATWPDLDATDCGARCFSLNYATVPASPAPKFWEYTNGVPLLGIWKLYERTHRRAYLDYVKHFVDTYVDADGTISYARAYPAGSSPNDPANQDTIQPAILLFGLLRETGDPRYAKALDQVRRVIPTIRTNPAGAFWHKPTYPNQQWLDGIYMTQPFLVRYGAERDDPAAFDIATRQILLAAEHTYHPTTGLAHHAWNGAPDGVWLGLDPKAGKTPPVPGTVLAPVRWSRAMGWYVAGIVDVLEYLPRDHPERSAIVRVLSDLAAGLARHQDAATGLWYQVTDVKDGPRPANGGYPGESVRAQPNFLETSSSALFTYALAKGVRLGVLPGSYRAVARRGWNGVTAKTDVAPDRAVTVHGTVAGMSVGGTYNAYTNVDTRTDVTSGELPAPPERCSNLPTDFTSAPLGCRYSYVRDNVPQGFGAVLLAASELEH
jgi:unsaturated rhamnogalacturonyl hydrolase